MSPRPAASPPVGGQHPGQHLERGRAWHLPRDPDETRMLPGAEVALRGQEGAELGRRQQRPAAHHDARHDLVPRDGCQLRGGRPPRAPRGFARIGHAVHRRFRDGGVAQQGPLDRRGAEVLPVDPQPLAGPSGEPAEPAGVHVAQVAAPVHPVAHPALVRVHVVVVPGEQAGTRRVHQFADGFGGVEQLAAGAEAGRRAPAAGLRVQDRHPVGQRAERPRRGAGGTADRHAALGRAEPVYHRAAEPFGEPGQVARRALVAVGDAERVVRVVGALRRGQHVAERLAHVVRVGRAPDRLRLAARPRREDQHEQVVRRRRRHLERGVRRELEPVERQHRDVHLGQQRRVTRVGQHVLAVGPGHVPGQGVPAADRVERDEDRTRERAPAEQEGEFGHVVGQHPDVERPVRPVSIGPVLACIAPRA